jgi:hypothetical protein
VVCSSELDGAGNVLEWLVDPVDDRVISVEQTIGDLVNLAADGYKHDDQAVAFL